ncbi:MAG: DUF4494 domain-containing protein [Prevotella sp.]
MRSKAAVFFECKVRYEKKMEDGCPKKVTEVYVVDALTFTEAEARILAEMSHYVSGELDVVDLKIAQYKGVFFADSDLADKWYKARLAFITIDKKTDKEKKTSFFYLINAGNIDSAIKNINDIMASTMFDYNTCNVSETSIMDVFEYKPADSQQESEQAASE